MGGSPIRRLALALAVAGAAFWLAPAASAAGWCGSGESATDLPDATTGPQVHAVYVIPSDSPDQFPAVANQIADDAASIDTWWAGQDPTRTLRFDQAVFPSCTGLDITFLRMTATNAQVGTSASAAFELVVNALYATRLSSIYKRYLVYYDGPAPSSQICGTGGGDFATGPGFAVVWRQACAGVPTDSIAAHELLHTLGALPAGAPNACPNDPAHPCDSATDVLYPFASGQPLSQLVLDFNHDDYYAHSGSWLDMQDSAWLHLLQVPEVALGVVLAGSGEVTSDLPGIDCTASCTTQWDPGSAVTLTAQPASSMRFVGWQGACTGIGVCKVTLSQAVNVSALFGPLVVPVRISVSGRGSVVCTPRCGATFTAGATLTLRAVAKKGWRFVRWSGSCTGTRTTCVPSTTVAVATRATFKALPKPEPKPKAKKR